MQCLLLVRNNVVLGLLGTVVQVEDLNQFLANGNSFNCSLFQHYEAICVSLFRVFHLSLPILLL